MSDWRKTCLSVNGLREASAIDRKKKIKSNYKTSIMQRGGNRPGKIDAMKHRNKRNYRHKCKVEN